MNRSTKWVLIAVVVAAMGWMVYSSMARVQHTCEVCVEFNGGRRCTKGAGATKEEATQGAKTAACGVLAGGMSETIACQNAPPVSTSCTQ